ncbi:MAG TPA: hypothetical protein VMK82_04780 [Steroidobacteraceae bacterium]|nr:hypothetical protein [Steroidobacteraceae bacterium]
MQSNDPGAQARASEQLNRAREQLERSRQQAQVGREQFETLADSARALAERQQTAERELRAATGNRPPASLARSDREVASALTPAQRERQADTRREMQRELEALQRDMDSTRRAAVEDAPRAARQLAEARQELQEQGVTTRLSSSARQIEGGQERNAANLDWVITDNLERLAENLESAAQVAASETGRRQAPAGEASTEDLAAELGDLRRMMDRAREQSQAQNRVGGDAGTAAPNAQEGQAGQQGGGQQGQQGEGGQGQQGQGGQGQGQQQGQAGQGQQQGNSPGQQGGAPGGADGGGGNRGQFGAGNDRFANNGRFIGGTGSRETVAIAPGLRAQTVVSAERLAQIREELRRNGMLSEPDARALDELAQGLRRGGADPMNAEYQRMAALVNQLELAMLKSAQDSNAGDTTRATEAVDDSRQYRDNVAEYYRRLGGGDD